MLAYNIYYKVDSSGSCKNCKAPNCNITFYICMKDMNFYDYSLSNTKKLFDGLQKIFQQPKLFNIFPFKLSKSLSTSLATSEVWVALVGSQYQHKVIIEQLRLLLGIFVAIF